MHRVQLYTKILLRNLRQVMSNQNKKETNQTTYPREDAVPL